jgi:hypothetical protein
MSQCDFKGGLRLLFQPWHFGVKTEAPVQKTKVTNGKNCFCLPLKDETTFKTTIQNLKLPRSYPHDIAFRHHVPVRLSRISDSDIDNIGDSP